MHEMMIISSELSGCGVSEGEVRGEAWGKGGPEGGVGEGEIWGNAQAGNGGEGAAGGVSEGRGTKRSNPDAPPPEPKTKFGI